MSLEVVLYTVRMLVYASISIFAQKVRQFNSILKQHVLTHCIARYLVAIKIINTQIQGDNGMFSILNTKSIGTSNNSVCVAANILTRKARNSNPSFA